MGHHCPTCTCELPKPLLTQGDKVRFLGRKAVFLKTPMPLKHLYLEVGKIYTVNTLSVFEKGDCAAKFTGTIPGDYPISESTAIHLYLEGIDYIFFTTDYHFFEKVEP